MTHEEQRARSRQKAEEMAALYRSGLTLQKISECYGVTAERVRQLLSRYCPVQRTRKIRVKVLTPIRFRRLVYRWLFEAGYAHCSKCNQVKCRQTGFCPGVKSGGCSSCKRCTADRRTKFYHKSPDNREKAREWQRQNKDKVAEYHRRWRAKNLEKDREYQRRRQAQKSQ